MYCTDFVFNGERLSDHNLMICNFDGSEPTQNGGDVTFITVKPPYSDKYTYYTYSYETPISLTFSICKNPCKSRADEDLYFDQDDQSYLKRWLQRTDGYFWLAFDQEGFEDVMFHAKFNLQPHFICGRVAGYDVTVDTDAPYGYSQLQFKTFSLSTGETFSVEDYSDKTGAIYPKIIITPKANGTVSIESGCNKYKETTIISNAMKDIKITLDKENDFIDGLTNLNNFNFVYPIIANEYNDITSTFKNIGDVDCTLYIEYRHIRRVDI